MKATLLNPLKDITTPVGSKVTCKKSASNIGGTIIKVFDDQDNELGALTQRIGAKANGAKHLLPNTEAVTADMQSKLPDSWEATIVGYGQVNTGNVRQGAIIEFVAPWEKVTNGASAGPGNDVIIAANVQGASVQNPQKPLVIADLQAGKDVILTMKVETDTNGVKKVYLYRENEKAGFLSPNSMSEEEMALLVTALDGGNELEAKAFGQTTAAYRVKVLIPGAVASAAAADAAKNAMAPARQRIIDAGICTAELLSQIEDYCLECGVPTSTIGKVFDTFQLYPEEAQVYMVAKPKTMYKDVHGYILEAIACILAGEPLLLSGDAGAGKNCFEETIAWIFQRPLLDVAINAQTDKYDLLGSKTITVEENDAGQPIQKVSFQVEHLARAMEWGGFFNTDELNFADPGVAGVLHSVADTRRALEIPGYGKVVAAKNFQLLATMNVDYAGTHELNPALDSRYTEIVFDMPESILEILEKACPFADKKSMQVCDKIYKKILVANNDRTLTVQVSARNFIKALNLANNGLSLKRALVMNLANKMRDEQYRKVISEFIDMTCPK